MIWLLSLCKTRFDLLSNKLGLYNMYYLYYLLIKKNHMICIS